ncbi:competence protein CoiA family protein [Fundicoccus sp. Sow4_H7]|uniref:competence protein CoiA family protein n=1 Tax=Fundicoccus sp. Sow4_H7 TaxID=3438784 RepID=UPI003F93AF3F
MNVAKNQNGKVYYITQPLNLPQKQKWYCLKCDQPMYLKKSKRDVYYFSHITACGSGLQKKAARETSIHQKAKKELCNFLKPTAKAVHNEFLFPRIQQTADVYWETNESSKIVLEFQHSPIPRNEVIKRHKLYLTEVDQCIWLLNEDDFNINKMNFWHFSMLQYNDAYKNYWISLDLVRNLLVVRPFIPLLYKQNSSIEERFYPIDFNLGDILKVDVNSFNYRQKMTPLKKTKTKSFEQQLNAVLRNKHYYLSLHKLYRHHLVLSRAPRWILEENWYSPLVHQPMWEFFAWLIVELKEYVLDYIDLDDLKSLIMDNPINSHFHFCYLPLIDEKYQQVFFEDLIKLLVDKGLLYPAKCGFYKILVKAVLLI